MSKPFARITYKPRDGVRATICTVWPSRSGKGYSLSPCLETKETKFGPEMSIFDAFKAAFIDKSGFIDLYLIEDKAAPRPVRPVDAGDFGDDSDGTPF